MPIAISYPPDWLDTVMIHPVSPNCNVMTDLNVRIRVDLPGLWADVVTVQDLIAHGATAPQARLKDDDLTLMTRAGHRTVANMFCLRDDGSLNERLFRRLLRDVRGQYPGRDVYVPGRMGFRSMPDRDWTEILLTCQRILQGGRGEPCFLHVWAYA